MTVKELMDKLNQLPQDATVIVSSGDYPVSPSNIYQTSKFDGYITPGFSAKRRDIVVVISGGF